MNITFQLSARSTFNLLITVTINGAYPEAVAFSQGFCAAFPYKAYAKTISFDPVEGAVDWPQFRVKILEFINEANRSFS